MSPSQILIDERDCISARQPRQQAIPYIIENWNRYFSADDSFRNVSTKCTNQITRNDIFNMSINLRQNYSWDGLREFFISIMLWGFGTTGYGAFRTNAMVTDKNFQHTIESSYKKVNVGNVINAYNSFSLRWCGSAFFSKFFYFSAVGSGIKPLPLILDAVVARSLEEKCKLQISQYARVNRNKKDNNRISSVNRYVNGYKAYIDDMHNWAENLKVNPDQIELFLFS